MRKLAAVGLLLTVLLAGCGEHHWTRAQVDRIIAEGIAEDARAAVPQKPGGWMPGVTLPAAAPAARGKSLAPAPRLSKGKPQKVKGKIMATWRATGAGDASYNGLYHESGTYNGKPVYRLAANPTGNAIWWNSLGTAVWAMSTAPGDGEFTWAYAGNAGAADLPANPWGIILGTAPAPTVAEVTPAASTVDPFDWNFPLNYWLLLGASAEPNSNIQPAVVTLGGAPTLVLPYRGSVAHPYGFYLADLTVPMAPTWLDVPAAEAFWPQWADALGQNSTIHDAGDGVHVHCFGQPRLDTGLPVLDFAVYDLTDASQTSLITMPLDNLLATNAVQVSATEYRFVVRDSGDLLYCSYYAGDEGYEVITRFAGFDADNPPPVGYTETLDPGTTPPGALGACIDHRFVRDKAGELYYLRRLTGAYSRTTIIPYRVTADALTRLEDIIEPDGGWAQTWGDYAYPAGDLIGEFGTNQSALGALDWLPTRDATPRASICFSNTGRHWLLDYGDLLLLAGWGTGSNSADPFVCFVIPATETFAVEGDAGGSGSLTITTLGNVSAPFADAVRAAYLPSLSAAGASPWAIPFADAGRAAYAVLMAYGIALPFADAGRTAYPPTFGPAGDTAWDIPFVEVLA